jgi:hypothetical protein
LEFGISALAMPLGAKQIPSKLRLLTKNIFFGRMHREKLL